MDYIQEKLKMKLQESKTTLDAKSFDFVPENVDAKINILLSQQISDITYNGEKIDTELVAVINQAVAQAKKNFEKEMFQIMNGLGIKM